MHLWTLPAATLIGPASSSIPIAFSPDHRILASGGGNGIVKLWSLTDPTHPTLVNPSLSSSENNSPVISVAFSPDGHILASASYDGSVWLWNPDDASSKPAQLARQSAADKLTGTFLEVETKVLNADEVPAALESLRDLLAEFGIGVADLDSRDYTDLVMRARAGPA